MVGHDNGGQRCKKPRIVADNRKARFNYFIDETFEAGVSLTGTEVKSLRLGKATIAEAYADARGGEIWLINSNIPEYLQANRFNHAPKRPRKLLLHKSQINKLVGAVEREGMTLIPLKLYFNEKRPRQDRACVGARQEALRQARHREEAQLGPRARPADAAEGLKPRDAAVMLPTKLDHCVIHVSDWERSNAFYHDGAGRRAGRAAGRLCLPFRRQAAQRPRARREAGGSGAAAGRARQQRPVLRMDGADRGCHRASASAMASRSSAGRCSASAPRGRAPASISAIPMAR